MRMQMQMGIASQTEMFAGTKSKKEPPKRANFAHLLLSEEPSMGQLMPKLLAKDQETKSNFFVKLENPDS